MFMNRSRMSYTVLQKNNFCYSSEKADARDKPAAKIREKSAGY